MTYSQFDDALDGHPKRRKVGWEAFGLWCGMVIHCGKYLTDGHLDSEWLEEAVPQPRRRTKLLDLLLEQRMVHRNGDGGLVVHDYLEHNPSREEVLERRRKAAEKKRAQRMSPGDKKGDGYGDF